MQGIGDDSDGLCVPLFVRIQVVFPKVFLLLFAVLQCDFDIFAVPQFTLVQEK